MVGRYYFYPGITTKTYSYTDDLFKNYFAKHILQFIYLNILFRTLIIFRNDVFPYYKTNQISLCCMILRKFLTP